MPSPFPGMNPYLEAHWGDVHAALTVYSGDQLQPQLPSDLIVRLEEYPAVELERFAAEPQTLRSLRIFDGSKHVITAIELLSPANKVGEAGRQAYRKKQQDLMEAGVSLVEIDLLREGSYVLALPEGRLPPDRRGPYRITVLRSWRPGRAEVYRVSLRERLPAINIPLRPTDADVVLDLQSLLERC